MASFLATAVLALTRVRGVNDLAHLCGPLHDVQAGEVGGADVLLG